MEGNTSFTNSSPVNGTYDLDDSQYACGTDPMVFFTLGLSLGTVGIIGNISFMFVVMRVKSMQTITNYYLVNLAGADLLYLLCLWIIYMCLLTSENNTCVFMINSDVRCLTGMVVDVAILTSTFCVAFISFEHYIVITKPFRIRQICTKSKTRFFNALMWILAIVIKIPSAVECHVGSPTQIYVAIIILFIIACGISLCTVTVLYSLTAYHFMKSSKEMRKVNESHTKAPNHEKSVLRLCILTTVLYFICLFPKIIAFIFQLFHGSGQPVVSAAIQNCIVNLSIFPLMVHSAANPILCNIMSKKYRRAYKQAFMSCFGKTVDEESRSRNTHHHHHTRTTNEESYPNPTYVGVKTNRQHIPSKGSHTPKKMTLM
ncbi:somatostatin receptor type 4-like [Glandiceps talaboti]